MMPGGCGWPIFGISRSRLGQGVRGMACCENQVEVGEGRRSFTSPAISPCHKVALSAIG
jgi:hypothetical protein